MKRKVVRLGIVVGAVLAAVFLMVGCEGGDTTHDSTDNGVYGGDTPMQVSVCGTGNVVTVDMDVYMLQPQSEDESQKAGNDINQDK